MTPSPPGWSSTSCRYEPASGMPTTAETCVVLIEYTCCTPSCRNGSFPCTTGSESRSRAVIVTVPGGAGAMVGTREPCTGRT